MLKRFPPSNKKTLTVIITVSAIALISIALDCLMVGGTFSYFSKNNFVTAGAKLLQESPPSQ